MFKAWRLKTTVDTQDEEEDCSNLEQLLPCHERKLGLGITKRNSSHCIAWQWSIIPACILAASYLILLLHYLRYAHGSSCRFDIFNDIPIKYEYKRFERAGFHDSRQISNTVYEGRPNKHNDAAWDRLLGVGVVNIFGEENARLTNGSARTTNGPPGSYMVELEMFHQFHCLRWIRDQFWQLDDTAAGTAMLKDFPQRRNHTDHCIDYLRQSIMCHGDVTPITFEYVPEIRGLIAHHSTEHQCRDFKAIYSWAKGRRVKGFHVGGNHRNVELKDPEKFD
ncbi:hypothetical protein NOR_07595 [Metarhizium rileyi]|uniref:Tat pathway signal sequence n=1 Tax=Metarhizium rileyi (strain RCEF 4871) TaxID=1649241 RepID=A0A166XW57_METRR|nr:hypothetical protein NOR_07595 [Metarhizium rileyi RCEF 4871]